LAASSGKALIKDNKAVFNNKYAVEVFRFLQNMYQHEYFSKEKLSSGRDPFISQRIALKFSGSWEINYLEKFKDKDFTYDFLPMPVPDNHQGEKYTYCDPKNIVIFNTCKNPQIAWEFVKTMINKQGDLRLMELTGQFPRRKNLNSDTYFQNFLSKNPKLTPFARQTRYIKGVDNCEVIVEVLDIISQEYEACVIYNTKTPESAIADAEKAVNILLANQTANSSKKHG
jgi:multiple sugar transport system substrate-binding protein